MICWECDYPSRCESAEICYASIRCEHGTSFNEPCPECYELDLEDRAAQEDAENDSFNRGYLGR